MIDEVPGIKFDLKDRKILHELDKDARATVSVIGKIVGLSAGVVKYRIERLQKAGVIKEFVSFINTQKVGYRFYNIYVKYRRGIDTMRETLREKLMVLENICWLVSTKETYDLIICVLARDVGHFQKLHNDIMAVIGDWILKDTNFIVADGDQRYYPLLDDQEPMPDMVPGINDQVPPVKLQPIDYLLLDELSTNCRATAIELAKKLKTDRNTITSHVNKLISGGILVGFKPLLDMSKLGKEWHLALLRLKHISKETKDGFITMLKKLPQTFFIVNGVGNWDMQLEFYCDKKQTYEDVMKHLFPDLKSNIISDFQDLTITAEHKCVFYPAPIKTEYKQETLATEEVTRGATPTEA